MADSAVRVRFAPSPTGELHVGGARTALFNWLYARKHDGTFVLRFEDTDLERNRPDLIDPITDSFRWLGLEPDEGPFFQSERLAIYEDHAERLLEAGQAYRCYCTAEELEAKRQQALAEKRKPLYDGRCRHLTDEQRQAFEAEGRRPALRLVSPPTGSTVVKDRVRGVVEFDNAEIDDLIIMRSDGRPTYNFAVVIDDATMGITHVIRADEHLNNTPKQILIYDALGVDLPEFAHVPMVLAKDRSKLSKRHGATTVQEYRNKGYLPEAMVNHLARLGWSYGDQEIFDRAELIDKFSIDGINPSASIFDDEKLTWLNHHYVMNGDPERIGRLMRDYALEHGILSEAEAEAVPEARWVATVDFLKERRETLADLAQGAVPFLTDRIKFDQAAVEKHLTPEKGRLLNELANQIRELPAAEFNAETLDERIRAWLGEHDLKLGAVAQPCRVALTGLDKGPGLFETMAFLGQHRTAQRLDHAVMLANQGTSSTAP
ncbi:MAG: glutamate--tRNA ligase [Candidatus Bipolaricaulia bacterium]